MFGDTPQNKQDYGQEIVEPTFEALGHEVISPFDETLQSPENEPSDDYILDDERSIPPINSDKVIN